MKIFIDEAFKCHVSNDGTMQEVETSVFDGKCAEYIEGFYYEPVGETSGVFSPWKPYAELAKAQEEYEAQQKAVETEKRIKALEEENAMLMECLLEMSAIVYA